jgi:RHS repeat-associated protein
VAEVVKFQYVWDVRYVDTPALRDENKDPGTDNDCTEAGDERLYYVNDANMNVTALVDGATGEVVERYMYDPYGRVTVYEPDWSDTVAWEDSVKNELLFAGYRFDSETGLYATDTRVYHPTLGAWLGRDAGYIDTTNLYQYCRSNPAALTDPTGLCGENAPYAAANAPPAGPIVVPLGFNGDSPWERFKWWLWQLLKSLVPPVTDGPEIALEYADIANSRLLAEREKMLIRQGKDPRDDLECCLRRIKQPGGAARLSQQERDTLERNGYDPMTGKKVR